jgi:hypothetical protein
VVDRLVAVVGEPAEQVGLQLIAGVVSRNVDAHSPERSAAGRRNAEEVE